ncbi:MAG: hypothetical protein GTN80_08620 [Nitrososphaeria archaeon]|nr:hypothetical protein [Nitrososphaeria archaeon]NIN53230.1 hypothetical protein [Nitrososphaeria archaeon]NIQ33684.1 hypothetical protein [Nitrososphaeria archaeon]
MSSAELAAQQVKDMDEDELIALVLLEKHLKRFDIFPFETLLELSGFTEKYLRKITSSLVEKKLIFTVKTPYEGISLLISGLDLLALHSLSAGDVIDSFGREIGVGKEADIFDGLTSEGSRVSLKFYRIGRISFRDVARKRAYVPPESRVPWMLRSIEAAKKEFIALRRLFARDIAVPKPIARDRHVVVMEYLDGEIVAYAKEVLNPEIVLEETLGIIKDVYKEGLVNADLSAFNIFVTANGRVILIDWPQAMRSGSKRGKEKLLMDIKNVCDYFKRRFGIATDYTEKYNKMIGN